MKGVTWRVVAGSLCETGDMAGRRGFRSRGNADLGPHTDQTCCSGLSVHDERGKRGEYLPMGPTDVANHRIARLDDVARGGWWGMVRGEKRKGGNKRNCADGSANV